MGYRWVAIKLVINVVLVVLVLVLRPGVHEVAQAGRDLAAGRTETANPGDMVWPPTVSTLALSIATTLSVFKPGGRLRRRG